MTDSTHVAAKNVAIAFHLNPALWLLIAIGAAAFLESFALLVLYHASDRLRSHVSGAFIWCVHPFTGPDGRPSWTKLVDLLVLGAYWGGAQIPQGIGYFIIASAHGTKVLLAVIDKMNIGVAAGETLSHVVTHAETITKVDERHENIERKYTDDGVPRRSNPPVAGAVTASGETE